MGPLNGIKIVEFAGIGPAPFCGMLLADMGAELIRLDRAKAPTHYAGQKWDVYNPGRYGVLNRGRRSLALNLKDARAVEIALKLTAQADGLLEGFRPGVMERLGLGPQDCMRNNEALVYGRMTGWGQDGPLSQAAGHDLNYIAISGALAAMGSADRPPSPPLNLVGDFGGGGLMLAYGMVCALLAAARSGKGQVVDAAMSDGAATLMAMVYGMNAGEAWQTRGRNRIDGGAHFYGCYECADGKYISVGANEPAFYDQMLELAGIDDEDFHNDRMNPDRWPLLREKLASVFRQRTRDEWTQIMEGSDACFAPVLDVNEAPQHPHNRARKTFIEIDGVSQPAPAPRFSRDIPAPPTAPPDAGQHSDELLTELGFSESQISELRQDGVVA